MSSLYGGRYNIIKVLYECGKYKIVLAEDTFTGKRVTLKVPREYFKARR